MSDDVTRELLALNQKLLDAIEAICVRGMLNCREYWMKACTSPRDIDPDATRTPPMTAIST